MKKCLPLLLRLAEMYLPTLGKSPDLLYADGRWKAMKCDYLERVMLVMRFLLGVICLQFQGLFCVIHRNRRARPITVAEIAKGTKLPMRVVERILHDLKAAGFIEVRRQRIGCCKDASLLVAPCVRFFTDAFWEAMGLLRLFKDAVAYAWRHGRLRFILPKTRIRRDGSRVLPDRRTDEERRRRRDADLVVLRCPRWRNGIGSCDAPCCPGHIRRACLENTREIYGKRADVERPATAI